MIDRWFGFFATANHAGAICATVFIGVYSYLHLVENRGLNFDFILICLLVYMGSAALGLLASQSRSSILAVFVAVFLISQKTKRFWGLYVLFFVLTMSWLLIARGVSVVPGGYDVSSVHHVSVWTDSLVVLRSNWLLGCGWGGFGRIWMEWYAPRDWDFGFTSALSSQLTLLVELGVIWGWVVFTLMLYPLLVPIRSAPFQVFKYSHLALCISGLTCTLYRDPILFACWLFCLSGCYFFMLFGGKNRVALGVWSGAISFALVALAIVGGVLFSSSKSSVFVKHNEIVNVQLSPLTARGDVFALRSFGQGVLESYAVLKRLSDLGWNVGVIDGFPEKDDFEQFIRENSDAYYIFSGHTRQLVPEGISIKCMTFDVDNGERLDEFGFASLSSEEKVSYINQMILMGSSHNN